MFIFFKYPEEVFYIVISNAPGYLVHLFAAVKKQLFCFLNADMVQVVHICIPGLFFEEMAQIASVHIKEGGEKFDGQIVLVVAFYIDLHLFNCVISRVDALQLQYSRYILEKLQIVLL